jgi:hypothetical protein
VWDEEGGGSPAQPLQTAIVLEGGHDVRPPSTGASHMDRLLDLWTGGDFGTSAPGSSEFSGPSMTLSHSGPQPAAPAVHLGPEATERVKARVRAALPPDTAGRITYEAQANAVRGTGAWLTLGCGGEPSRVELRSGVEGASSRPVRRIVLRDDRQVLDAARRQPVARSQ